eukprot:gene42800-53104_t
MRNLSSWLLLTAVLVLGGCAHPISIQPKVENIERSAGAPERFKAKVGYFIPQASLDLEVTTAGGGGDNVRYFPYRDIDAGFQRMLANVFETAVRVASMPSSGSTGVFTWPPTNFSIDLTTHVRDGAGALVASPRVVGAASVGSILDMKGNFGLTGQLAMQDALLKSQAMLHEAVASKLASIPSSSAPAQPGAARVMSPVEERLRALRELRDKDLLTPEEYERRRQQIRGSLPHARVLIVPRVHTANRWKFDSKPLFNCTRNRDLPSCEADAEQAGCKASRKQLLCFAIKERALNKNVGGWLAASALCASFLLSVTSAHGQEREVSFAGVAYSGQEATIAQRFPYALRYEESLRVAGDSINAR